MSTRRQVISVAVAIAGVGGVELGTNEVARSAAAAAGKYPIIGGEALGKLVSINDGFPPGDIRRYGIVANDPAAASANAKAFKELVAPAGKFSGSVRFPNVSGSDVYHFDDVIVFHDDIRVDLSGSSLMFHKISQLDDANSGFLFALRNFQLENGSIVVDYEMARGITSAGSAIHIGNRGADSVHVAPTYDSRLSMPLGNVVLRNLRIASNVVNGNAIEMTGGLSGVTVENVWIDGGGRLKGGIYYEFGWATPGPTNLRETSHAHNLRFVNITVNNLNHTAGAAVTLAGAYNSILENLYVDGAAAAFVGTPGESLNYRPWKGVDQIGVKRTIVLRNIIASRIGGTAITFTGAQRAANGYLAARVVTSAVQTDLGDYYIDGFAIDGTSNGWGILTSAGKVGIRNGRISGFQRGIVLTDDCTQASIDSVDVVGCAQAAIQLDMPSTIWNPPRAKLGEIRNCFLAGNSTQMAGAYPAIDLNTCAGFLIQDNRIGYEPAHDGQAESTQGNAIQLGARCSRVLCLGNYVGGVGAGAVAYFSSLHAQTNGNTIQLPGGSITTHGCWDGVTARRQVVAFAPVITINATGGEQYDIDATSAVNFRINIPLNPVNDKVICMTLRNSTDGALGHATWDGVFRMSSWTNPSSGHNRSIMFRYEGSYWLQIAQTGVDIPN